MSVRRFESTTADPFARGVELGRFGAADIHRNLGIYRELFQAVDVPSARLDEYGDAAIERISTWAPPLLDELRGVAEGAGVELRQLGVLNARTEILATVGAIGEGECSTVSLLPADAAPRTIQTWDWHDTSNENMLVARHPSVSVLEVRYFTEFGIVAKIGLNSAGLGLHFNILTHDDDGDGIGVPVHAVARWVLENARTVDEAVEIARSAQVSASTSLTVVSFADGRPTGASIELSPSGAAVISPADGWLVHTNHFLDPGLARGELMPSTSSSYPRASILRERREAFESGDVGARAAALVVHDEDGAPVCCHPDPAEPFQHRWETLLTIALDVEGQRLRYHHGTPCTAEPGSWQEF